MWVNQICLWRTEALYFLANLFDAFGENSADQVSEARVVK